MMDIQPGSYVAGLRIDGVAGRGGMGVVYRAFDATLHRPVALKVIGPAYAADPEFRERFRREARTAARVEHPHFVSVYSAGEENGLLFLVMRYVDGTDMAALVKQRGRLDPVLATTLVAQVASALDTAHAADLVHRDVKPGNVLVTDTFDNPHAYLSDFGLTRPIDASHQLTGTGQNPGTPAYTAPELRSGSAAGVLTDVYALGCTLFYGLAGRLFPRWGPLDGPGTSLSDVLPDQDLAAALDTVVRTALAVDPADRYSSAGELARAAAAAVAAVAHDVTGGFPAVVHGPSRAGRPDAARGLPPVLVKGPAQPSGPIYNSPDRPAATEAATPAGPAAGPVWSDVPATLAPSELAAGVAPTGHRPRWARWAVAAGLVAAGVTAVLVSTPDSDATPPASSGSSPTVALQPVQDDDGTVHLTWDGPAELDYAVEVYPEGHEPETFVVGRTTTLTVTVDPAVPYCFSVRGTDADTVAVSNTQPLRGATCDRT